MTVMFKIKFLFEFLYSLQTQQIRQILQNVMGQMQKYFRNQTFTKIKKYRNFRNLGIIFALYHLKVFFFKSIELRR